MKSRKGEKGRARVKQRIGGKKGRIDRGRAWSGIALFPRVTAVVRLEANQLDCLVFFSVLQINEAVASTSGDSAGKNVTGNQITVTLADK